MSLPTHQLLSEGIGAFFRGASAEVHGDFALKVLEYAAEEGMLQPCIQALEVVKNGGLSVVGYRGLDNRTLFDAAARGGSADIISVLLAHGAKPDAKVVSVVSRRSALYTATSLRHQEAAVALLMAGADPAFRDPGDDCDVLLKAVECGLRSLIPLLVTAGASVNTRGKKGRTPLHMAAKAGYTDTIQLFLLSGADKDARDDDDQSPVIYAAVLGHRDAVRILMDSDVDVTAKEFSTNRTLLHLCAMHDFADSVADLARKGEDINALSSSGSTPLIVAASRGSAAAVTTLLGLGASLDIVWRHRTALSCAAMKGHVAVLEAFVKYGVDVNTGTPNALRAAVGNHQAGSVDVLIKAGANVERTDEHGYTSLLYLVSKPPGYSITTMTTLLRHGADVSARTVINDSTALLVVCRTQRAGFVEAIELLLLWGADETAVDKDGSTAVNLLDKGEGSDEDKERASRMLARAPFDRKWRRRRWIVVLRSRLRKVMEEKNMWGSAKAPKVDPRDGVNSLQCFGEAVTFLVGLDAEGVFRHVLSFL